MTYFSPKEDSQCIWRFCGCAINRKCLGCSICSIIVLVGVILTIVLLAVSIKDVDENEMAIPYGTISRDVGNVVDTGKRAFAPDTKLYTYDSKFISNFNTLNCLSKDGLVVGMDVVQQYSLIRNELKDIFFEFGDQSKIDDYVDTIVQDTVRDICARFNGEEFFSKRGDVELEMANNLTFALNSANAHVQAGFVQLRNINLPTEFLTSIQKKQLALEDVDVALNERAQTLIQAETRRQQAELDTQILLVRANASASAIIFDTNERSNAKLLQWAERAKAFIIDLEALNINAETYVDEYLFVRLKARTLTPSQQACLQTCPENTSCWFCFTTASPSVVIN